MTILALDTATGGCSVAIYDGTAILAHRAEAMYRGQSEALMPMVQAVATDAGLTLEALSAIAVTRGPGAFTGLRIGLAAARGLALSLGVPCIGVTTLEAVAHGVPEPERQTLKSEGGSVLVSLDSRRADVFVQVFTADLHPLTGPEALHPDHLPSVIRGTVDGPLLVCGDRTDDVLAALETGGVSAALSTAPALPDAAMIAALAWDRVDAAPDTPPQPLYLRPPDAVVPKNQGRLRP